MMTSAQARLLSALLDGATIERNSRRLTGRRLGRGERWIVSGSTWEPREATVSETRRAGWVSEHDGALTLTARGYEAIITQRGGETALQKQIVPVLERLLPWAIVLHIPNGGKRSRIEAKILKGMGTRAGAADISVTGERFAGYIEVKKPTGEQSPEQAEFEAECSRKGIPYAVVHSVREAEAVAREWAASRGLAAGQIIRGEPQGTAKL